MFNQHLLFFVGCGDRVPALHDVLKLLCPFSMGQIAASSFGQKVAVAYILHTSQEYNEV
jgi:hypothetical protein